MEHVLDFRRRAWRFAPALLAIATACGSPPPAAPAITPAQDSRPATVAELTAVGEQLMPQVPAYGYYTECINFPENGAPTAAGENDYSACPITPRLRAAMEYAPPGVSPKAIAQAHFCPCQQNPSVDRVIKARPGPGGGTIEIALYGGHVKVELLVVRAGDRLLVDDVAAKGDFDSGPVAFAEKPASPVSPPSPPSNSRSGDRILDIPWYKQAFPLSCEAASLRMALAYRGISTTDAQILAIIGSDPRAAAVSTDGTMRWGNPYLTFVGNANGSEVALTGYGTYYPTIAKAAAALGGQVLRAGEGITPADVYQAIRDGHPVVAWVTYHWVSAKRRDYVSFDEKTIPYAGPVEHAVTVYGVTADDVYINDPWNGRERVSRQTFETSFATYNHMAVILQ
jgi:uncharacterized protein YvpB